MSLAIAVGAFGIQPVSAATAVALVVDDEFVPADIPPVIHQGRVMVPLRWVAEALGSRVAWDSQRKIASVDTDSAPGNSGNAVQVWVKGKLLPQDTPVLIRQGRVLVSARLIAEALGANVEWDAKERTVYIRRFAYRGPNEWETVKLKPLTAMQFVQPSGWGFSRSIGAPPADKQQKQLDRALDEVLTVLKEGKRIKPRELTEPIRHVYLDLADYIDSAGKPQSGGRMELALSGSYGKLVWQGVLSRPVFLQFSNDRMNSALDKAEKLLPAPFPTQLVKTTTLPRGYIKSDSVTLSPLKELPYAFSEPVFKQPVSGEWSTFIYSYEDQARRLLSSPDGINWHEDNSFTAADLAPLAIGLLSGAKPALLMTNARDGGIYRTELGEGGAVQQWKKVWNYPLPEAVYKYPPVRYIPDPAASRRVYATFDHDTRNFSTNGLFMSEDGGLSWFESGINGESSLRFVFPGLPLPDPIKSGTVYMQASLSKDAGNIGYYGRWGDSVFVSRDAGRKWIQLDEIHTLYGLSEDAEGVVVTAARHGLNNSWLLTSRDHGASWSERKLPFKLVGLQTNPDNPHALLATVYSTSNYPTYYSADGGATWRVVNLQDKSFGIWLSELNLLYFRDGEGTEIYRLKP